MVRLPGKATEFKVTKLHIIGHHIKAASRRTHTRPMLSLRPRMNCWRWSLRSGASTYLGAQKSTSNRNTCPSIERSQTRPQACKLGQ
jgi:hypothetical protein